MKREHFDARPAEDSESGFTLIELMMVVLIIAILIAVMLPTFLGASRRANDRATQTSLRNALVAAKTVFSDNADYTRATPAALNAEGVPVKFVDGATPPTGQNSVSVDPAATTYILMGGQSKSGTCFYLADDALTGTVYATQGGAGGCAANGAPVAGDPAWKTQW